MNTPGHAVVNLAILGRAGRPERTLPIVVGAVLPDLPLLAFFAWERFVRAEPQRRIWSERYFDPGWQTCFDLAHSIPLALAVYAIARRARPALALLAASVALHALFDLPLHHDDAHRHFLPLSGWRFQSPVSYWDPRHHGALAALAELVAVAVATVVVWRRLTPAGAASTPARRAAGARRVAAKATLITVLLLYAAAYLALYVRAVPPIVLGTAARARAPASVRRSP